jgi:SAM-dependent methyltransferase
MRLHETRFLDNGCGFNHGQGATLIEVEVPADYDALLSNIVSIGYYDGAYFATHSGYKPGKRVAHFVYVAELAFALRPSRVLEVGCGRGDVLSLLVQRGVEVTGVDFSQAAAAQAWPELVGRFRLGELSEVCRSLRDEGERFDLVLGFDIWEHLHPARLEAAIASAVGCASDDALFFFVVPAFGVDAVFGESFPLEFEQNRAAFEACEPFRFLLAERTNPPIPASGHLVWAHTQWWERTFAAQGLVRLPELERPFHQAFDRALPHSVRSFYLFRRATTAAAARVAALERSGFGALRTTVAHARFLKARYVDRMLAGPWWVRRLKESFPPGLRQQLNNICDRMRSLLRR